MQTGKTITATSLRNGTKMADCEYCGACRGQGFSGTPPCLMPFAGSADAHKDALTEMWRKGCLYQSNRPARNRHG